MAIHGLKDPAILAKASYTARGIKSPRVIKGSYAVPVSYMIGSGTKWCAQTRSLGIHLVPPLRNACQKAMIAA